MAEIQYYGTHDEAIALACHLVEAFESSIYVDNAPTPKPRSIRQREDIAQLFSLPIVPLLHITSPMWSLVPLTTTEIHANDGRHFFSIDQRYGGPSFLWSVPQAILSTGRRLLRVGSFGDWPSYYLNKGSPAAIARPKKMQEVYQLVVRRIRAGSVRSRWLSGRAGPWVSPGALTKMREGYELSAGQKLRVPARPLTTASTRTRARAARAGNAGR